jgi:2-methylcitrate dehydratase PrpD
MQAHREGSIALPVQIGLAARAAVTAADLAAEGLVAAHDVLEGPFGHFALLEEGALAPHVATLGRHWRIAEISVKPWPCGRASHGVLGALAGRGPARRVEAHVPPLVARLVGRPWQADMAPAYARLCLPFLAALIMADGRIDPRRFAPETFRDKKLMALGDRVNWTVDANPDPNALAPQRVVVDGEAIDLDAIPGAPARPLSSAALADKRAFALDLADATDFEPLALLTGATA